MAKVIDKRMTVEIDGTFVVFLIGMRVNKPWKLRTWVPVFLAMPKMLRYLAQHARVPASDDLWQIRKFGFRELDCHHRFLHGFIFLLRAAHQKHCAKE